MPAVDQQRFDALYLQEAESNARRLERFGIDGLRAFRAARGAIVARSEISCREGT